MAHQDQPTEHLQDVRHIRNMMERSSRFLSLSGFSGIAAGTCALVGAVIAQRVIAGSHHPGYEETNWSSPDFGSVSVRLIVIAAAVFASALLSAFYFTWIRVRKDGVALWNSASRRLFWSVAIPVVAGAAFILGMLWHNEWRFVAGASLFFYGLALINASKYTLTDIRFLGLSEVILGFTSMFWIGYGLYFWAVGFGLLHIIYGIIMWYKYERR